MTGLAPPPTAIGREPRRRRQGSLWAVGLSLLLLAGCGVPLSSPPTAITQVPYNLMEPAAPPTPQTSVPTRRGPFIYWVNSADRLTPIEAGTTTSDTADAVAEVLPRLAQGPSEPERLTGLSTALGPDVTLAVNQIVDGRADIDVAIGPPAPTAQRLPLAVGQVVLSLTSIPGVDSVLLTSDGTPIEAPLPDGVLTARPLTAADFTSLVANGPAPTKTPGS
jgi:spore germination protein GerM